MDRNRGILTVIACILVIGIAVTCYTGRLISKQEYQMARNDTLEQQDALSTPQPYGVSSEPSPDEAMAKEQGIAMAGAEIVEAAPAAGAEHDLPAASPRSAVTEYSVISPLEQPAEIENTIAEDSEAPQLLPGSIYDSRLREIDIQIEKMRSLDSDLNTNSMKTTMENELKLWDSELNSIYSAIMNKLEGSSVEILVKQEREWMIKRDAGALEASKRYGGGTMEGVEYLASLISSTRERAYELAEEYREVLMEK